MLKNSVKRLLLFCILNSAFLITQAQVNLVPNPSFENHINCPLGTSQIHEAVPWFQPSWGTPDLFDSCDMGQFVGVPQNFIGQQAARTGNAYAGIFIAYPSSPNIAFREYLEVKLNDSLSPGLTYFITFYASLSDSSHYASDAIEVYFSADSAKSDTSYRLHFTPQIQNPSGNFLVNRTSWVRISGQYAAAGGEKFITIGNFKDNANTDTLQVAGGGTVSSDYYNSYYFIDDVCVSLDSMTCYGITASEELSNPAPAVFPNPATSSFIIRLSTPGVVKMYTTGYDLIISKKLGLGNNLISSSILDNGMYYVEIAQGNIVTRSKIIINN